MIVFIALWISLFLLRGAAYFWESGLLFAGKERFGMAGILPVILEVDFANDINVSVKKSKCDLFLPLLTLFVAVSSGLISFGICRWFKLI